jgi:3'-phosphoadenosine 5'-phosphosulfate sulfotransferase (PAPS reductase)/FAD synthetase
LSKAFPPGIETRSVLAVRKQTADNAVFVQMWQHAKALTGRDYIEAKADRTAQEIKRFWAGKRCWFGWSGGKDSIALAEVCRRAGITHCCFAMTRLEYPAFLSWVTENMPEDLEVVQTGLDLNWLCQNLGMLFPQDAATAAKWFGKVQHTAQRFVVHRYSLDGMILGRRREDGNYIGPKGANWYERQGVLRHSPMADWTHAEVLALIAWRNLPMPPIYTWPNGFVVGTGAWAARQYTGSIANGWREVDSIDPSVVQTAATRIVSARKFLETKRSAAHTPSGTGSQPMKHGLREEK